MHKALGIGIAAFALLLATPSTALASSAAPWEPELNEGPYIFEGSIGVPNVIVDVVKVGRSFYPETGGDIWGAGEFNGPQGQFRVDIRHL
jgi:type IV secretory pathway VirB2 component (pilin)